MAVAVSITLALSGVAFGYRICRQPTRDGCCIGQIDRCIKAIISAIAVCIIGSYLISADIALHKHFWSDYRCSPTALMHLRQFHFVICSIGLAALFIKLLIYCTSPSRARQGVVPPQAQQRVVASQVDPKEQERVRALSLRREKDGTLTFLGKKVIYKEGYVPTGGDVDKANVVGYHRKDGLFYWE